MKYWRDILIVLLIALLVVTMVKCSDEAARANYNLDALTNKTAWFENRIGNETATKKTLQVTNAELRKILLKKNDTIALLAKEFSRLTNVVNFKSTAKLPAIGVKLEKPLPVRPCDSAVVDFERAGNVKEKWFKFNYKITPDSLKLDNFTILNNTTVITGVKKKWFLGAPVVTTDITHTNPYIKTDNITAAEITVSQPWYKKWYLWLGLGIAGGLMVK